MATDLHTLDFTRYPLRGVLTEVAREEGVTRQAIHRSLFIHHNPRIRMLVAQRVQERLAEDRAATQVLGGGRR